MKNCKKGETKANKGGEDAAVVALHSNNSYYMHAPTAAWEMYGYNQIQQQHQDTGQHRIVLAKLSSVAVVPAPRTV
jgi:hypothetical protein